MQLLRSCHSVMLDKQHLGCITLLGNRPHWLQSHHSCYLVMMSLLHAAVLLGLKAGAHHRHTMSKCLVTRSTPRLNAAKCCEPQPPVANLHSTVPCQNTLQCNPCNRSFPWIMGNSVEACVSSNLLQLFMQLPFYIIGRGEGGGGLHGGLQQEHAMLSDTSSSMYAVCCAALCTGKPILLPNEFVEGMWLHA